MTKTLSTMLPLGTRAPDFSLLEPQTSQIRSLTELKSDKATVILFICNHCPFVVHIKATIIALAIEYQAKGINFIAINANDIKNYPDDAPEKMSAEGYPFPYLFDDTQEIARAYQAVCTPDCYIFDKDLHCVYRGRFDESRPGNNKPVTGKDLCTALDQLLNHETVGTEQYPSIGCNIKWKDE